jgi:hypothetical protein
MGRAITIFALLAVVLFGCTKPEAAFTGKWQLDPKTVKSADSKADPVLGTTLGLMVLDFKEDKTFVLSSRNGDQTGTFDVDSGTVTMKITSPAADAPKKPLKGKLTSDGKAMTVTGGDTLLTMKFTKL